MLIPLFALSLAHAGTKELVNDDCACDGSEETIRVLTWADGECWGSTYVPDPGDYPFTPMYVSALIAPSGSGTFDVFLYNVNADNEPISQIDGEAYQINGSTQSMAKLEFADAEIEFDPITEGNVAVVMCEDGQDGPPAIAADGNGLDHADRNWVYGDIGTGSMHWYNAADLGVPGDWIMRLGIETDNIESDADTDADADADADADSDSDTDTDADAGELKLFAISPANAKVGEAINVVVSGAGFVQGAQVHIGGASLVGATVQDDGTISGRTPTTLPAGVHDVDVVNPDGTSAYLAGAFTVEGGCGCATTPVPAGAWAAATLVGLVVTRRRKSN